LRDLKKKFIVFSSAGTARSEPAGVMEFGFNMLFKKLRDTGTVNRWPGSGRPRSARTRENDKPLFQIPQSTTDFVLPIIIGRTKSVEQLSWFRR